MITYSGECLSKTETAVNMDHCDRPRETIADVLHGETSELSANIDRVECILRFLRGQKAEEANKLNPDASSLLENVNVNREMTMILSAELVEVMKVLGI